MKTLKYLLRQNKIEIITFLAAILGYIASYIYIQKPELTLLVNIIITLVATIVIIYSKVREKDFYFLALSKQSEKEDWLGDGIFEYDRNCDGYIVTKSFLGFIFSKCLIWSDYKFEFEAKILNTSIGVILRATNLSNFIMLQFFEDGIKPHVWTNGFFKVWESTEAKLSFKENLSLDKWYKFNIRCDKRKIYIKIIGAKNTILFDRSWDIPTGSMELQLPENAGLIARGIMTYMKFPINLEYGTIGFRNYDKEKAVIRNVLIEKL